MSMAEHLGPQGSKPVAFLVPLNKAPKPAETITLLDGKTYTFTRTAVGPDQIEIGKTAAQTVRNINAVTRRDGFGPVAKLMPTPKKKTKTKKAPHRLSPERIANSALEPCRTYANKARGNVDKIAKQFSDLIGKVTSRQTIGRWINAEQEPKLGNAVVLLVAVEMLETQNPPPKGETQFQIVFTA